MSALIPADHFQRLFQASPAALLVLLPDPGFTIAAASDEYLRVTLTERDKLIGRPVFEVFPDNPLTPDANSTLNLSASFKRVLTKRVADVMAVQRYDVPRADGQGFELRYWNPVNTPVFGADGKLLYIVHRVDNVTDYVQLRSDHAHQLSVTEQLSARNQKMASEIVERNRELDRIATELRSANEDLSEFARRAREETQRKDEFLAMLAHELRNPLAAISSALQLWTIGNPDPARQQQMLGVCRRQVHNLTRMVDDLLEMSRVDRGAVELQMAPIDLRDLVASAMHASRDLFERNNVSVSTRVAPASFRALGDTTRLEQVLSNLLTNAAKYSNPGGNVEVRLSTVESHEREWARIEVTDEGRGIPPEKLGAIFDMFVQVDVSLDRSRGGLGIGLSLVRALVELHGGRVAARSAGLGHGSTFIVELPLLSWTDAPDAMPVAPAHPDAAVPRPEDGAHKVVIVEDNADARHTLETLLTDAGYEVRTAASGDEGVARIIEIRPQVAIVDIGLPGIDGFEVARRVRRALGFDVIKLVALTGYSSAAVRSTALDAGFDLHLVKPLTLPELSAVLETKNGA